LLPWLLPPQLPAGPARLQVLLLVGGALQLVLRA
jgi:hypothetical protein